MEKEIINTDFDYYKRTLEKAYKDYYKKILVIVGFLLILLGAVFYLRGFKTVEGLIIPIILIGMIFILKKYIEILPFIEKEKAIDSVSVFAEDVKYYYIPAENLKFNKKNSRNLTSKKKGITFFIGIQPLNVLKPVHVRYYDMLDMSYTDKYKLNKNKVSFVKTRWRYRIKTILMGFIIPVIVIFIAFGIPELRWKISKEWFPSLSSKESIYEKKEKVDIKLSDEQLIAGKAMFWKFTDTNRDYNLQKFYQNLNEEYMNLSEEDQYLFTVYTEAYLDIATECAGLDMACKVINGYISDDTARYFYLWVISQGEETYLNALKDPDSLAKLNFIPFEQASFEEFAYVGYEQTSMIVSINEEPEQFNRVLASLENTITYKNSDRYGGFTNMDMMMETIPEWLPNLIVRAEEEKFDWKNKYNLFLRD